MSVKPQLVLPQEYRHRRKVASGKIVALCRVQDRVASGMLKRGVAPNNEGRNPHAQISWTC